MAWWVKRQNIAGLCQQTFQFSSADSFSWSCFPSCWIGAKIQISSKIAVWQSDSMKQDYRGFTFTSDNENPTNFHLYKTNNFLLHAKPEDVRYFLQFLDVQILFIKIQIRFWNFFWPHCARQQKALYCRVHLSHQYLNRRRYITDAIGRHNRK